jgi:hypothetical protein
VEQFIKVSFTVPHAYQHRTGTKLLGLAYGPVTHQPLEAFLLFKRQLVAAVLFARLRGIASPALDVEHPSGVPSGVKAIVS